MALYHYFVLGKRIWIIEDRGSMAKAEAWDAQRYIRVRRRFKRAAKESPMLGRQFRRL